MANSRVQRSPAPQGQSTTGHISVDLFGSSFADSFSLLDRVLSWCDQERVLLRALVVAGLWLLLWGLVLLWPSLALLGVLVSVSAWWLLRNAAAVEVLSDQLEAYVADVVGVSDVATIGGKQADTLLDTTDRALTGAAREWLMKAKLHFGELKDSTADRIVLKRWLAEAMKKADMRDKDACGLIPVVVEFMFIPTCDEALGAVIRSSRVAAIMRAAVPKAVP